jgi:hypothetical protein
VDRRAVVLEDVTTDDGERRRALASLTIEDSAYVRATMGQELLIYAFDEPWPNPDEPSVGLDATAHHMDDHSDRRPGATVRERGDSVHCHTVLPNHGW